MIIKKIFDGDFDDEIHNDFVKFSRGEFKNKYLIYGKKQAKKRVVKTGAEFANFIVRYFLPKAGKSVAVTGIISTTLDIASEATFPIAKVSQFQGVKKLILKTEVNPQEIIGMMNKYPKAFFALSFKIGDIDVKIKAKPPKAAKANKKDNEGPTADFCVVKTNEENFLNLLFWDIGLDWTEIKISHSLNIDKIVYPKDMTNMKPAEIREKSKRQGVLIRNINIDNVESSKEANFIA